MIRQKYQKFFSVFILALFMINTLSFGIVCPVYAATLVAPSIRASISGTVNKDIGSISVKWNSVDPRAYYYIAIRKKSTGKRVWTYSGSIKRTSYKISSDVLKNLEYSTKYYIFVTAHKGSLKSVESNHLSFTTRSKSSPRPNPTVPTNVTATATSTTVTVTWAAVPGATSYDVSLDGNIKNVTDTSYTYTNLNSSYKYSYFVRSKNNDGVSAYSTIQYITTVGHILSTKYLINVADTSILFPLNTFSPSNVNVNLTGTPAFTSSKFYSVCGKKASGNIRENGSAVCSLGMFILYKGGLPNTQKLNVYYSVVEATIKGTNDAVDFLPKSFSFTASIGSQDINVKIDKLADLSAAETEVNNGAICIIRLYDNTNKNSHYVLLDGINASSSGLDRYLVSDPDGGIQKNVADTMKKRGFTVDKSVITEFYKLS